MAFLADMTNLPRWDPKALRAEKTSGGPVRPGSTFRIRVRMLGMPVTVNYRVEELSPGRKVVLRRDSRSSTSVDSFALARGGHGIDYVTDISLRGPARIFEPLLRRYFSRWAHTAAQQIGEALDADELRAQEERLVA